MTRSKEDAATLRSLLDKTAAYAAAFLEELPDHRVAPGATIEDHPHNEHPTGPLSIELSGSLGTGERGALMERL